MMMDHVDWTLWAALLAEYGEEGFADMVMSRLAEMQDTLKGLGSDPMGMANFHFLRCAATQLGFESLGEACTTAELACDGMEIPDVEAVRIAFAAAMAEVAQHAPDLAPDLAPGLAPNLAHVA